MDIACSLLLGAAFGVLQFWLLTKLTAALTAPGGNVASTGFIIAGKLLAWCALLLAVTLLFSTTAMLWAAGASVACMLLGVFIHSHRQKRRDAAKEITSNPPGAQDAGKEE